MIHKQTFVEYVIEHPYTYGCLRREQLPVFAQVYLNEVTDRGNLQQEQLRNHIERRRDALFVRLWCSSRSDQTFHVDSTLDEGKNLEAFVRHRLSLEQDTKTLEEIVGKLDTLFWLQMHEVRRGGPALSLDYQQRFRDDRLHPKEVMETLMRTLKAIPALGIVFPEMQKEQQMWKEDSSSPEGDERGRTLGRRAQICDGCDNF